VKRLREALSGIDKVILDTSFVLPYVGVRIRELDVDVAVHLGNVERYYPYLLIPELMGVLIKVCRKMGFENITEDVLTRFNSLIYGGDIGLIYPDGEDIRLVYKLLGEGFNDIFDAILYSTSIRSGISILTLDKMLLEFLIDKGFYTGNIIVI